MSRLSGKRILITGGTRGIGRAIAQRVLAEGAEKLIIATEESTPPADFSELSDQGTEFLQADMASETAPGKLVRDSHAKMGGIDGLVHCAGVYLEAEPGDRSEAELWNLTVNIKARGGYLLACEFSRLANEGASFVGITSINAEQSEPDHLAYDPACAALGGVIRAFSVQHAPWLRFNALAPGLIHTQLTQVVAETPEYHQHACQNIPMRCMGKPEDCAGTALFLLSDDSAYITGETIYVDGGIRANQMSLGQ